MKVEFSKLQGKTITDIFLSKDKKLMVITCDDGYIYKIFHYQNCCEDVHLEDICGDLDDLIGTPILLANESTSKKDPLPNAEYFMWTFYTLRTIKDTVTLRWWGNSNGFYSVDVEVHEEISQEIRDNLFGETLVKIQESQERGEKGLVVEYKEYLYEDFIRNYYDYLYKIEKSIDDNWISIDFKK